MDCIAIGSTIQIESSKSPITFETQGGGSQKVWDRFLCVEGKQAFHIGNISALVLSFLKDFREQIKKYLPEKFLTRFAKVFKAWILMLS